MFELSRLNVHRIVASEEEKSKLIEMGFKEVTREDFMEEITSDKVPDDEKSAGEPPATGEKPVDEKVGAKKSTA